MSSPNRAAIINKIQRVLKKHYKPVAPPSGRSVLEHLLYACCLENARFEAADEAFAKVQQSYFDLNEVRVTTVSELCEILDVLPDPQFAASNLKRALQAVFESHFDFDIEYLRKQNLGKSEKDLEKYTSANPFLIRYVAQHGLAGHSIPCGRSELEVLMIAGLINEAELEKRTVPGLERAIPKAKGIEFASLLHQLAADYLLGPNSTKVRSILLEIDPESKDRFPKRGTKKEATAPEPRGKKSGPAVAPSATSAKKKGDGGPEPARPEKHVPKADKPDRTAKDKEPVRDKEREKEHDKVAAHEKESLKSESPKSKEKTKEKDRDRQKPKDKEKVGEDKARHDIAKAKESELRKGPSKGLAKKKPR
jgi:endonuclease-3